MARFAAWIEAVGYASYDPYDVWGTRYGLWARRIYYERGIVGAPFIAPILLIETLAPPLRKWFVKKQRYATADAQLILALLQMADDRCQFFRSCVAKKCGPAPRGMSGNDNMTSVAIEPGTSIRFLEKAVTLGDELLSYSIPGFRGYCWGYPFHWQNNKGLWHKNTPYITCTPYAFEAFLGLFDATGNQRYLEIAASIARFVAEDLKDTPRGPDAAAASYSPFDESKVVNASAYRAFVLFEAVRRLTGVDAAPGNTPVKAGQRAPFPPNAPSPRPSPPGGAREDARRLMGEKQPAIQAVGEREVPGQWSLEHLRSRALDAVEQKDSLAPPGGEGRGEGGSERVSEGSSHAPPCFPLSDHDRKRYLDKARRNLNFILQSQRDDGSWLYAIDNPAEAYIDHFHTCFVLKNLFKLNRHQHDPRVKTSIKRGYGYYRHNLFDARDNPKPFAIRPRTQIAQLEMYDVAEAITLGALLRDDIPEAFELAHKLARRVHDQYQLPDGHFVTRVYRGGIRHTFPFLRWPQAQLFYALTNLLAKSGS